MLIPLYSYDYALNASANGNDGMERGKTQLLGHVGMFYEGEEA